MHRREMLASLAVLPFAPGLLTKKDEPQVKYPAPEGVQIIAQCKPGTVFLPNKKGGWTRQAWSQGYKLPLKIIKHTPYRTTVESEVPCVITNLFYRGPDMVCTLLEDDSSIMVRRSDILRVDIWHHGHGTIFMDGKQTDYALPCKDPLVLALVAADREIADRIQGYRPGQAPWDPTEIFQTPYRNSIQYYQHDFFAAQQGWTGPANQPDYPREMTSREIKISLA